METTSAGVPEVMSSSSAVNLPPAPEGSFSGRREDFARDMALIAKEMGVSEPQAVPVVDEPAPEIELSPLTVETPQEPKQPEQPQAKAPVIAEHPKVEAPQVPDKFKKADGSTDYDKLTKSFIEAEKALKREQNKNRQPQAPVNSAPQNPQVGQVNNEVAPVVDLAALSPFEIQVARDIYNGGGFSEQQAIALAKVQVKLAEAQHQATVRETVGRVQSIEEFAHEQAMQAELKAIRDKSPEIFTPEGLKELNRVRQENPEIKSWTKAYVHWLGEQQFNKAAGGNPVLPTPKANTAPIAPVSAGNRLAAANSGNTVSGADLEKMLAGMTKEQENEFWKRNVPGARDVNRIAKR